MFRNERPTAWYRNRHGTITGSCMPSTDGEYAVSAKNYGRLALALAAFCAEAFAPLVTGTFVVSLVSAPRGIAAGFGFTDAGLDAGLGALVAAPCDGATNRVVRRFFRRGISSAGFLLLCAL